MLTDLRRACRALARTPGFTAVAVLTLALGVGATTAMFSVVNGVLLKPLPFADAGRLVSLAHRAPGANLERVNQGAPTYFTYLDHQRVFEGIGAWDTRQVSITGRAEPERVEALAVSAATLPLLGVRPTLGRLFTRDEDAPGAPPRVVLTHGAWQRWFGGAADAVGRTVAIDGAVAEVVGVLPASFRFLRADPEVVVPLQIDRADASAGISFGFESFARLRPGVTREQAAADVARMIPLHPDALASLRLEPTVRPLADEVVGGVGDVLWVLLGAVGVVLLVACANVANLLLIRAEGRQQEFAVRTALGASRGRIARGVLAEGMALALAAGALGLVFTEGAIALLKRLAPAQLPRVEEIAVDPTVLLFTLAVAAAAGTLSGLVTVARGGVPNATALREGGRGASDGPARRRTRDALVVAEVALALVLLVVSGLMVRTFVALRQVDPGFARPETVQTFRVAVPGDGAEPAAVARTHREIAARIARVPGVTAVGMASHVTMDGEDNTNPVYVEGEPVAAGALPPTRRYKTVAPGFFETMGIPVVAGRAVTWDDVEAARPVAVVSAALARAHWGDPARAIGRRVRGSPELPWREVVGVTGDERDDGLDAPATPIVYWPMLNDTYQRPTMAYAVRSARVGSPTFLRELRQAVWAVDPSLPVAAVRTLDDIAADSTRRASFAMVMLALAAGMALFLGLVGIHGVIAYATSRRTREVGLRVALGAQPRAVRWLFVREGLTLTAVGIAIGVAASLAATRLMAALLFGVAPTDPLTYLAVSAGLAAVAAVAAWLPARRAPRLDPAAALRAIA
ncbi:ABC transporter permease, partial [Roseisolibacter sp. H3M3-2]|uniref:ABC transporter permease n=1 Tax=Roseisolibacter sp. H3M3-2 TaxID=3031323 RepID=UPI0023DBF35E